MSDKKGMHVGKDTNSSAGLLSFLGGYRKIGESDEKKKKESTFSEMFSALRYTLLCMMLLWWIPIVGQAIAGYVGGRKAGTPARGMVVTLLCALAMVGVMTIIATGIIGGFDFLNADPSDTIAAVGLDFPLLGWILSKMLWFLQSSFAMIGGTTSMKVNIYIITVVFGLIGGIIAEQHRKEVARATPEDGGRIFMPRSLAAYVHGKKLGFENFDDRLAIQRSNAPQEKIVTVQRSLVRKVTAREEPIAIAASASETVAVQEAEERESPFAGLIHRAEKNDPEKERVRHSTSKEDMEYV